MIAPPTKSVPDGDLLGEIVSWDMYGRELSYAEVQDALRVAGLDPEFASELSTRSAFTRACKHLKDNRQIDKVKSKAGMITFQFTKKVLDGEEYEFDRECRVEVDTDSGQVSCDEKPELAKQAQELLNHAMQTRNASDVTRIIQNLFRSQADLYAINRKGAAYFCPEKFRPFTAQVEQFVKAMGGQISRFPVPKGTDHGNASVRDAVSMGLGTLLAELDEAVEGWDEKTRESTMEKVQAKYDQVAMKVDAYAEYLLGAQEGLREKLNAAKGRLVDRIFELTADEDEAAAEAQAEPVNA